MRPISFFPTDRATGLQSGADTADNPEMCLRDLASRIRVGRRSGPPAGEALRQAENGPLVSWHGCPQPSKSRRVALSQHPFAPAQHAVDVKRVAVELDLLDGFRGSLEIRANL